MERCKIHRINERPASRQGCHGKKLQKLCPASTESGLTSRLQCLQEQKELRATVQCPSLAKRVALSPFLKRTRSAKSWEMRFSVNSGGGGMNMCVLCVCGVFSVGMYVWGVYMSAHMCV